MPDPLKPGREHTITAAEAAELTQRHRERATAAGTTPADDGALGGLFDKAAVLKLLEHGNATYLRYYHARSVDGQRTVVLVAADVDGNDLLDGGAQTLDQHWPCPPYCPEAASILRG